MTTPNGSVHIVNSEWFEKKQGNFLPCVTYHGNGIRRVVRWLRRMAACASLPLNVLIKPDAAFAASWIPSQQAAIHNWADWCIERVVRWLRRTVAFISLPLNVLMRPDAASAVSWIPCQQVTMSNWADWCIERVVRWLRRTAALISSSPKDWKKAGQLYAVCNIPWQRY